MNERVTIITLTYNNSEYYKESLKSILEQTYEDIELLLVDDGSKEFNREIIEEYIIKNNRGNVRYDIKVNNLNKGIVKSYNDCIKRATGRYIFYLCIDDALYDKNVIKDVVRYFEKTNAYIFTGKMECYDENFKRYIKTYPDKYIQDKLTNEKTSEILKMMMYANIIPGACTPFRKEIINYVGLIDERFTLLEDYPRYIEILKKDISIGFYDRKLIKYRLGGITTNTKKNVILEQDYSKLYEVYIKKFIEDKYKDIKYKNKEQIGWGTSLGFKTSYKLLESTINYQIQYLIDSNKKNYKLIINNKKVVSPEFLNDKKNIFIWIFSETYYYSISEVLKKNGLKEFEDFCIGTHKFIKILNELGKL